MPGNNKKSYKNSMIIISSTLFFRFTVSTAAPRSRPGVGGTRLSITISRGFLEVTRTLTHIFRWPGQGSVAVHFESSVDHTSTIPPFVGFDPLTDSWPRSDNLQSHKEVTNIFRSTKKPKDRGLSRLRLLRSQLSRTHSFPILIVPASSIVSSRYYIQKKCNNNSRKPPLAPCTKINSSVGCWWRLSMSRHFSKGKIEKIMPLERTPLDCC